MPKRRLSRRGFLKLLTVGAVEIGAGALYAALVEPSWIDVTQIHLKLRRLPAAFSGFRLAQVTDFHLGSWLTPEGLQRALELLYAQNPDAVALTGDFIDGGSGPPAPELDAVREMFGSLAQRFPTFAVLGNHDYWTDPEAVHRFLGETGIRELRNDVFAFEKAGERLYLCGVDDVWEKHDNLKAVIAKLSMQDCAVLMAHEPDFADRSAATGQFDLQISGHLHGGQVVVPFFPPPLLPWLGRKYPTGLYRVGEMFQYTNRGLGMIRPAVRFNCRPEIAVFRLE
ncbi:MAG: metallophosphoesterase [Anaerolineales bacterium]